LTGARLNCTDATSFHSTDLPLRLLPGCRGARTPERSPRQPKRRPKPAGLGRLFVWNAIPCDRSSCLWVAPGNCLPRTPRRPHSVWLERPFAGSRQASHTPELHCCAGSRYGVARFVSISLSMPPIRYRNGLAEVTVDLVAKQLRTHPMCVRDRVPVVPNFAGGCPCRDGPGRSEGGGTNVLAPWAPWMG